MSNIKWIFFTACTLAAAPQPGETRLTASDVVGIRPINSTTPGTWSGGALMFVESAKSASPVFRTFDSHGQELRSFTLSIPGASLINVYSGRFARGIDGSIAVAGSALTSESRGAAFLAWIAADHERQTVVRVSPFIPNAVTIASDGTIWAAGTEVGSRASYPLIRRFDRQGRLLGSFVQSDSLTVSDQERFTSPADHSYLASSRDQVGWFSEAAGIYVSFANDGTESRRLRVRPPPNTPVYGLALCDDGNAFVGLQMLDSDRNWGVVSLDVVGNSSLVRSDQRGYLLGCDGTTLVIKTNVSGVTRLRRRDQQ